MNTAFVGLQWGDEGKGKSIDEETERAIQKYFTEHSKLERENVLYGFRAQGGDNAGHTIVVNGKKIVLHLIPSTIPHERTTNLIASGVVVNPQSFQNEITALQEAGISVNNRVGVSDRCHLILPYHIALDCAREVANNIGTTLRGIGPCYEDKAVRSGLRVVDLVKKTESELQKILEKRINEKRDIIKQLMGNDVKKFLAHVTQEKTAKVLCGSLDGFLDDTHYLNTDAIIQKTLLHRDLLAKYIADTALLLHHAAQAKIPIIGECAQGSLLDIDHGTYPFVTPSPTGIAGLLQGAGVWINFERRIGVMKAYTTRVGSGPFPTQMDEQTDVRIRETGKEYGATTGRTRKCGGLDIPALRYAIRKENPTELHVMKLDVLDDEEEILVCTSYKNGNDFCADAEELAQREPVYRKFPGWKTSTKDIRMYNKLPPPARAYLEFLQQGLGVPITLISVGAERGQTIRSAE